MLSLNKNPQVVLLSFLFQNHYNAELILNIFHSFHTFSSISMCQVLKNVMVSKIDIVPVLIEFIV